MSYRNVYSISYWNVNLNLSPCLSFVNYDCVGRRWNLKSRSSQSWFLDFWWNYGSLPTLQFLLDLVGAEFVFDWLQNSENGRSGRFGKFARTAELSVARGRTFGRLWRDSPCLLSNTGRNDENVHALLRRLSRWKLVVKHQTSLPVLRVETS